MSANELKQLGNEINFEIFRAVETEVESQVKAFLDARPREFGDYGSKLDDADTKTIAQRIRDDIKRAKKLSAANADHLPAKLKVSVRAPRYGSIDISITESPVVLHNPANVAVWELNVSKHRCDPDRYTLEGQRILNVLERIANQYNYDRSDIVTDYFDVNFYLHVDISHRCAKPEISPEFLADMRIMKLENDAFLGRQLESINAGRAWAFGHGVLNFAR